jgi:hypothetical protein
MKAPVEHEYIPGIQTIVKPTYPLGTRCPQCGHLWALHTEQTGYVVDGTTSPPGCTQCQSERAVMDEILDLLGQAFPEFRQ